MEPTKSTKHPLKSLTIQGIALATVSTFVQILVLKKVISNEVASIVIEYLAYVGQVSGVALASYGRIVTKGEILTWKK